MKRGPFVPRFEDLPQTLAIFPLSGVLLLPRGKLPLNIFEPRYLQMVDDAMSTSRVLGMVQPASSGEEEEGHESPVSRTARIVSCRFSSTVGSGWWFGNVESG